MSTKLVTKIKGPTKAKATEPPLDCEGLTVFNKKCNESTLRKEEQEREALREENIKDPSSKNFLYPTLNDPDFNVKIALKKEFNDSKYDGAIVDVEEYSNILNNSSSFELQPHQLFVKNFLSTQTPYNSLLLYHGLGSGKTCSAIGICEEHRDNEMLAGSKKKIIIIASPNVQDNFRLQLFDERKLKQENGAWNIDICTNNKLLKEINPTNIKNLTKENIIKQVNDVISSYYDFMGYIQFSNIVDKIISDSLKYVLKSSSNEIKQQQITRALNNYFSNRLIVIDEVHNIRIADDNPKKSTAINLMSVIRSSNNVRLLLLSATPMYNNYTEIIWLLNLMNANDRRGEIKLDDIFYQKQWKKDDSGRPIGKDLFIQKSTGYISFVRGEDPYTFPFRIYPNMISESVTKRIPLYTFDGENDNCVVIPYPSFQMNGMPVPNNNNERSLEKNRNIIKLTLSHIGSYQMIAYKCIVYNIKNKLLSNSANAEAVFEEMESFGFKLLQKPLEALNMIYPVEGLTARASSVPPIKKNGFIDNEEVVAAIGDFSDADLNEVTIDEDVGDEEKDIATKEDSIKGGAKGDVAVVEQESPVKLVQKKTKKTKEAKEEEINNSFSLSKLIGEKGLKNTMNYDNREKAFDEGTFEYKPSLLKNKKRGRIFTQENIRKYSSKIARICDSIYDPATNTLSKGIILIYSQFIYSGLIPMALALEEMGFTRYGKGIHSTLFKTPPRDPLMIDVIDKNGVMKGQTPAKYVMITGDKRLSKDNDLAVKDLTEDSNVDGYGIKIVLISKAGSEGLDFKAIRQIHIIDPWYNMNRIEQIIGRGVRNFSHKKLPFSERNTEIFLHATLLKDKKDDELDVMYQLESEKEAADLYVYRVAEKKAQQIGAVARVLKENAVDCIVNHEQTNFVQSNFTEPVKQTLSIYGEIDYQVGDAPYSAVCDYMESCEYNYNLDQTSNPAKNAELLESLNTLQKNQKTPATSIESKLYNERLKKMVNDDTYVTKHTTNNLNKIMQKINELFKTHFFYKKKELFAKMNTPKTIPTTQIYAGLNTYIHNPTEYITDKYGRFGNLVNIGEYYLFQPVELVSSSSLSSFERITPIDYKHQTIRFNHQDRQAIMPRREKNIDFNAIEEVGDIFIEREDVSALGNVSVTPKLDATVVHLMSTLHHHSVRIMNEYRELTQNARALSPQQFKKMTKSIIQSAVEDPWYGYCGVTMHKLLSGEINDIINVTVDSMKMYLLHHIVDMLSYADKVSMLNYIYNQDESVMTPFEKDVKAYAMSKLVHRFKQKDYAILFSGKTKIDYDTGDDDNRKIYILRQSSSQLASRASWSPIDMTDEKRIIEYIGKHVDKFKEENLKGRINFLLGFVGYEKMGEHLLFKIKDINNLRNIAGARCDQFSKSNAIINLNKLIGQDFFNNDNVTGSTEELCIMLEFICRHYTVTRKNNKIWFLTSEESELYNIEHCRMNNSKFDCGAK